MNVLATHPFPVKVLLVDDQNIVAEAIKQMLCSSSDIQFFYCKDPLKAVDLAREIQPTVILQDLVMPEISGLQLLANFRKDPATKEIPMIVLSSKEEPKVKEEAFALGANDYLVKLPDSVELVARIRYHSKAFVRLLEKNLFYEKLQSSQTALQNELAEAAAYVKSLLPVPLEQPFQTKWSFIPSTLLGGDAFGYHWLDQDHFALYLLDVCGHGVGAALLSISVINTLRFQTLPETNFYDPASVLHALNDVFQMERHNQMFFTIWYGVLNVKTREIVYASGGHPPAILLTGPSPDQLKLKQLKGEGLIIGGMPTIQVKTLRCQIDSYANIYLFSDGIYEVTKPDKSMLEFNDFLNIVSSKLPKAIEDPLEIVSAIKKISGKEAFCDDVSILQVTF